MGSYLTPLDVQAIAAMVPAACPACGGPGCPKCSHTGQAEFCPADVGSPDLDELTAGGTCYPGLAGERPARDLHSLARSEEEIERMLKLAEISPMRTPYYRGFAQGVAAAIRWVIGEIDDVTP